MKKYKNATNIKQKETLISTQDFKSLSKEACLKSLETMLLIRRFEERAGQLYGMGKIGGFLHLYIGQEAVVVGIEAARRKNDQLITSYRDHGHMIAVGANPKYIMAELTGKAAGCSKGKGGSMHMFAPNLGFYGGHGIVGAQVSIGTGFGFANSYNKTDQVSITCLGDGALHQGQVYESFNMAKLWSLPVIYVIENNQYAMGTSVARSTAQTELYQRGSGFDIPGKQVDGMNINEVIQATQDALQWCRDGNGPIILEMKTYRYQGHSISDPGKYRTRKEIQEVREKNDPIEHLKKDIIDNQFATADKLKEIDKKARQIVAECVEFALSTPEPDLSELWTNIYSTENK